MTLPDMQAEKPMIRRPIPQVGVDNVMVPFMLESKIGGMRNMIANVSMRTNLDENTKGISMSRLLGTLKNYIDVPLKQKTIYQILYDMAEKVESSNSFMKFEFQLPIDRPSPKSDNSFYIFHKCSFEGHLMSSPYEDDEKEGTQYSWKFFQGATVQYASYCPCSAELCNDLKEKGSIGFPHAQRSFAHIMTQCSQSHYIWLEDIIETVESAVKTLPYPVIKRPDEQEIARIAGENPIFVEDAIRAISQNLDTFDGIADWIVKCIHEESIHTSEAIAMDWKGVKGGFDGRYYL